MLYVQACRHSSSEPILDRWTHQHEEGTMPLSLALAAGVLLCWVTDECCRLSHCSTYPFGYSLTSSLVNNLYRRQRHPLAVSSEHLWGKQVRWRDVSAVTVAVLQRTPVIGSSAHYSNCIVFHTAWNGLIKDEGDILSSQVNTKTNQISEKKTVIVAIWIQIFTRCSLETSCVYCCFGPSHTASVPTSSLSVVEHLRSGAFVYFWIWSFFWGSFSALILGFHHSYIV